MRVDVAVAVVAVVAGVACLVMTVRDAGRRDDTDQDAHTRLARGHRYEELPMHEKQDATAFWPQLAAAFFLVAIAVMVL